MLFQYRARMAPGLALERLLEEEAAERGSDHAHQMHQGTPAVSSAAPADAMALDAL